MAVPQVNLYLESDDPTEVERLDEACRLLGADLLQIDDVTEVRLLASDTVPEGVRSGVVWQYSALSLVLGGLGYRVVTKLAATQITQVVVAFINRNDGKSVSAEVDGERRKLEAKGYSEQAVKEFTALLIDKPVAEPEGDDAG